MHLHRPTPAFSTSSPPAPSNRFRPLCVCSRLPPPSACAPAYPSGKAASSRRVFVGDAPLLPGLPIRLSPSERSHLAASRAPPGSPVTLLNAAGLSASGLLDASLSHATVTGSLPPPPARRPRLTVALCAPRRASRADWAVEKLCEVGATEIVFCPSARSPDCPTTRSARWGRVAAAAAKQSLAPCVARVRLADGLSQVIEEGFSGVLLCSPVGEPLLTTALAVSLRNPLVIVGPEGGLTEAEEEELVERGARRVRLGPTRLRVETAAVAAAVAVVLARDAVQAERGRSSAEKARSES